MYGSAVSKDLNLPAVQPQPQMSSPGLLLRYRSAPINLFGEDFHAAEGSAAGHHHRPDHAADAALERFLAGSHDDIVDCKPPRPAAPAPAPFLHDAASSVASLHQLTYQSPPPQQQMAAQMEGYYRTLSSGGSEHDAVGSGNSLVRQSSSPAGFLNHLNMDNGYGNVLARLKGQLSYSSRNGSVMPQISELGGGGSPEAGVPAGAGYAMDGGSSGWDDASPAPDQSHHPSGSKRPRDPAHAPPVPNGHHLAPQLSLPSGGGSNGKTIEKILQFQDAVPCKIRAKRGCATHPRSIAERVRRTRISERIRKLQELVPNMEKQTNTADMLDLAVDYAKDLQKQIKELNDSRANCTCAASKQFAC